MPMLRPREGMECDGDAAARPGARTAWLHAAPGLEGPMDARLPGSAGKVNRARRARPRGAAEDGHGRASHGSGVTAGR